MYSIPFHRDVAHNTMYQLPNHLLSPSRGAIHNRTIHDNEPDHSRYEMFFEIMYPLLLPSAEWFPMLACIQFYLLPIPPSVLRPWSSFKYVCQVEFDLDKPAGRSQTLGLAAVKLLDVEWKRGNDVKPWLVRLTICAITWACPVMRRMTESCEWFITLSKCELTSVLRTMERFRNGLGFCIDLLVFKLTTCESFVCKYKIFWKMATVLYRP